MLSIFNATNICAIKMLDICRFGPFRYEEIHMAVTFVPSFKWNSYEKAMLRQLIKFSAVL
jgi:hypothetical protein